MYVVVTLNMMSAVNVMVMALMRVHVIVKVAFSMIVVNVVVMVQLVV